MNGYKNGGLLSLARKKRGTQVYGCKCENCKVVYVDDHLCYGTITCPECGRDLERGLTFEDVEKLTGQV